MRAMIISEANGEKELMLADVPRPVISSTHVMVGVKFAAVNAADLRRSSSHLKHTSSNQAAIAGLEMAGVVVETGDLVNGIKVGDRVMGMVPGAYAEFCVADHRLLCRIPETMSFKSAAAVCVSFMTAHDALLTHGQLKRGDAVLIQGVSSGVGIASIQLAKYYGASVVLGTSRSPAKAEKLMALGLQHVINPVLQCVSTEVKLLTENRGANIIIDNVGADALPANIEAASISGRVVCVGRLSGSVGTIDLDELARKRLTLVGVTFRTRTIEEHALVVRRFIAELWGALSCGDIRPLVDSVFPLEAASRAQALMKSGQHVGKIVLCVGD